MRAPRRRSAQQKRRKFNGAPSWMRRVEKPQPSTRRARQTGATYAEQLKRDAEQAAQAIQARAEADADALRAQALAEVRQQVADLAIQAAERVIRGSLDQARQRQLVDEFLTTAPGQAGW